MSAEAAASRSEDGREWQLVPGEQLGPWKVVAPLGAGGMGEVYVAEHSWLPTRRAALKVLHVERSGALRYAERFRAEAALLASIDHPNVVRLYDAQITDDGRAWMAMELLSGAALNSLLCDQGCPEIPDTLQILGDVADGAHAAHLLGIVHRDLKPGNIFITDKHIAKVLDFGTSKLLERRLTLRDLVPSTQHNIVLGTVPYMSPEQLLGDNLDHRSDIYALGVIAYRMLSGHHPFVRDGESYSPDQLGYRALFTEPSPIEQYLPDCPSELWLFVRAMMARKREDRPASMAKVAEKLRALRGAFLGERGLPIASLGTLGRSERAAPRASGAGGERVVGGSAVGESPAIVAAPPATAGPALQASAPPQLPVGFGPPPPVPEGLGPLPPPVPRGSTPPDAWGVDKLRALRSTVELGADELEQALERKRRPGFAPTPKPARQPRPAAGRARPLAVPEPLAGGAPRPRLGPGTTAPMTLPVARRPRVLVVAAMLLGAALVAAAGVALLRWILPPDQAAPAASTLAPVASASSPAAPNSAAPTTSAYPLPSDLPSASPTIQP